MALELPQWGDAAGDPKKLIQLLDQWAVLVRDELAKAVPVGTMAVYPQTVAPSGWLLVDGSEFNQSKFPELYKVIGDTWGSNPGTFMLPDVGDLPALPDVNTVWMIRVE